MEFETILERGNRKVRFGKATMGKYICEVDEDGKLKVTIYADTSDKIDRIAQRELLGL